MSTVDRRRLLGALGAGLFGAATLGCASAEADTASGEEPNDADIGFLSDMAAHHLQALAMCERVLGRETGGPVQSAATEVLRNQSYEVGTMHAWLRDWGQSTATPDTVMAWMGMHEGAGMPAAMMPGLASDEDMFALATAEGESRGRLWLELMRAHHVGGVAMADAAVDLVATDKVRRLAGTQSAVQTYEIAQYDELLATTYANA